jgi:tetratricopeptide (TPR) repeat protein
MVWAASLWLVVSGCQALLGQRALSDQEVRLATTHRTRAALKLRSGEIELAIREYRLALESNPYDPEAHFGLGEALSQKGLLAEAEASLLHAVRLEPDHHDARLNLSSLYLRRKAWDRAIAATTKLVDDPTFLNPARALVNRAWAQYSAGRLAEAEADLRDALTIDSSIFQAHLNLGIVLYDKGEIADAMQAFERVLEILARYGPSAPGSAEAEARFRIAQARVKLGQREKAIAQLKTASTRGGQGHWGKRAREYLALIE